MSMFAAALAAGSSERLFRLSEELKHDVCRTSSNPGACKN
jgi:hypothetical protein